MKLQTISKQSVASICMVFVLSLCLSTIKATPIESVLQQNRVEGQVTDAQNNPIPGVSVIIKGTSVGTITDADGNYSIDIGGQETPVLVFSFIGMLTQEVVVGDRSTINITMMEDVYSLEEVVAIGYGSVRKSDLTGAVSSVKSEDLNDGVVVSVEQALQGKIAGVQINQTSAEPGGGVAIRIRGVNSITGGDEPLYVIDGLPINNQTLFSGGGAAGIPGNTNPKNPLNSINPNDIESIEVLKDASATAIYGSRGANGVILITTRGGSRDKTDVIVDTYTGFQDVYEHLDILSTSEYMDAMNDLALDNGDPIVFDDAAKAEVGEGTFWPEVVTRRAIVNNNNISVSGGSENSEYFISANYMKQEGIVRGTDTERYAFRVNVLHDFSDKLQLGVNLTNSFVTDNNAVEGIGNTEFGPYYGATIFDPTLPVYQDDGSLTISEHLTHPNPVYYYEGRHSITETNRVLGNLYLDYTIFENLSARLRVGTDRNVGRQDLYSERSPVSAGAILGAADVSSQESYSGLFEYTMTYQKNWNNVVDLTALAGATYENFTNRSFGAGISEFPTDILLTNNLGLGNSEKATVRSNKNSNSIVSYLFRANVSLYNKILLTSSFRIDGSSRFGANNKYAYFPSAAVAYKISEEDFIPELFSDLKLRASWGVTGNQSIGNYASLSTYSLGGQAYLGESQFQGTQASRIANPDLKWETTTQYNLGLDFGFFNNRIYSSADYFIKQTDDMLMNFPLPPSSGFNTILRNIGSMKNTGIELSVLSRNVVSPDFSWSTSVSFSAIQNEVTDIGSLDFITTGSFYTSTFGIIRPGDPLNAYYTYEVTGIFQDADEVAASAQPDSQPGNPIYLDANDDGVINSDDRVVVGKPWPDFTYGITNEFKFKNFDLNIYIYGQEGADLLNGNLVYSMHPVSPRMNRMREMIIDRWTVDNPDAKWPSSVDPNSYGATKINSLAIEDASFIKLQTVQLGYSLPFNAVTWIDRARIYVTGQNLLTLTNYSGLNPETNKNGQGNLWADKNSYPMARTYLVGLNLNF